MISHKNIELIFIILGVTPKKRAKKAIFLTLQLAIKVGILLLTSTYYTSKEAKLLTDSNKIISFSKSFQIEEILCF